jgi:lipopolysaccharide/colanic/teichoic acid biosynthesis glycosyltransferase
LGGLEVVSARDDEPQPRWHLRRIVDLVGASISVVLLLPFSILIGLGLFITLRQIPLRKTIRVGRYGRPFSHYRFRTFAGIPPRPTRLGRLVGNLTLDEIPAFWNVIRGDLSLIGPRPAKPDEVDLQDSDWQTVLSVRPGLCSPSLLALRQRFGRLQPRARLEPDLQYVTHRSWRLDLIILRDTVFATLRLGHLKGRF